jgi:hypothetical protein
MLKRYDGVDALRWNLEVEPFVCLMNYSSGKRHIEVEGGKRSHVTLGCWWKGNVLLLTCAKVSKRKGR